MRLSRRDRAAMTLSLCELRGSVTSYGSGVEALKHHDGCDWPPYLPPILADAEQELDDGIGDDLLMTDLRAWNAAHYRNRDLLRARLALLLRAVLRADSGDYGACDDDCYGCRWSHVSDNFVHDPPRRYRPLWEQVKP